jgi:hypothetical protein
MDAPQYNALNQFVVRDIERIANVMAGAVYVPKKEGEPLYFIQHRKERLEQICAAQEIKIEVKEYNNQLEITFRQNENTGRVQLWFSSNGFSKTTWHPFANDVFKSLTEAMLVESLLPEEIPFIPKFEFQKGLHQYLLDILNEENIPLYNIVQNQWNDQYFLNTGATCSMIEFVFNSKHLYSYAKPRSTLGIEDKKLQSVVDRLRVV